MFTSKTKKYTQTPAKGLCGTVLVPGQVVVVITQTTHGGWKTKITCNEKRYVIRKVTHSRVLFEKPRARERAHHEVVVIGHNQYHTTENNYECDCVGW